MIKMITVILYLPLLLLCRSDLDEKVKSFVDKYSSNYTVKESVANFSWILEKKTNPNYVKKLFLKRKSSTNAVKQFEIAFYEYSSEKNCSAAMDSILKCFPNECTPISRDKYDKGFYKRYKIIRSVFIFNSKSIIVANTKCESVTEEVENSNNPEWNTLKSNILNLFKEDNSQVIITGCGGILEWK